MSHPTFHRQSTPSQPAVDQAEAGMLLSALADGELSAAECERLMQHLADSPEGDNLLQTWERYHIAGECLRTGRADASLHSGAAFLSALRTRMQQGESADVGVPGAQQPQAVRQAQPQTAPAVTAVSVPPGREAANAAVFRWKVAAGVASLAAVAAIGWSTAARFSGMGQNMQLAAGTPNPAMQPARTAPESAQPPLQALAARSDRAEERLYSGVPGASPAGQGAVLLRDPQLDELLAQQYAHTLALQPPAPFLRNASVQQRGQ